ncbi:unnamed protein product [Ectocarpus sp. CCAP 1310/34]|nr:unnamed protein product [Ectocarpus sp. CCAP 1310/34]
MFEDKRVFFNRCQSTKCLFFLYKETSTFVRFMQNICHAFLERLPSDYNLLHVCVSRHYDR